jgi:RNA-directed DNA polymerase
MEELAPYMRGWRSYFGFCGTPEVLIGLTRRVAADPLPRTWRLRCWILVLMPTRHSDG